MAHPYVTRLMLSRSELARHPLRYGAFVLLAAIMSLAFVFYVNERPYGPPYDGCFAALRTLIVLATSGFDINQPRTTTGDFCAEMMLIVGIVYMALFTAVITSRLAASGRRDTI
ncbi:MAG: hypothetical protein NTY46_16915 [Candidatus Sumerlaeota bacterium]|nr:hypothetical protein [Candidatus Sumerlaeota bacterium]